MGDAIMVGMAEVKFTGTPDDVLIALGLGSCIAVCAYEPRARLAGMAHIVLPDSARGEGGAGRFADTAIPMLLHGLLKRGATPYRIRIALAGGAQLFAVHGTGARVEIGKRNAQAVKTALESAKLSIVDTDLGGSAGRSVQLTGDGHVRIKTLGRADHGVIYLGQPAPGAAELTISSSAPPTHAIDAVHHAQSSG